MGTIYSYARFSSDKQTGNDSIRRQRALADGWLQRHPEHILDTTLTLADLGVSAFKGANLDPEKGNLGKFIHLARQGRITKGSILLLERLDRFSRQATRKAYRAFCELIECGVSVQVLEPEQLIDETNIDSLEVVLPVIIAMTIAHEQSKEKSKRVKAAWQQRQKKARAKEIPLTRLCPSWLQWDETNNKWEQLPQAVKAVSHLFNKAVQGMGQRQLVKEMNAKHEPISKPRRHNKRHDDDTLSTKPWTTSLVQYILSNPQVPGEFQPRKRDTKGNLIPDGEPIANYFPRIIPDDLFYRVQAIKEQHTKQKGPSGKFINLLVGLLYHTDGHSSQIIIHAYSNGKTYRNLTSYGHLQGLPDACPLTVDYFLIEQLVLGLLWELKPTKQPQATPLPMLQQELDGITSRLAELQDALTSTRKSLPQVLEAIETLDARATELRHRIDTAKQDTAIADTKPLEATQDAIQRTRPL